MHHPYTTCAQAVHRAAYNSAETLGLTDRAVPNLNKGLTPADVHGGR